MENRYRTNVNKSPGSVFTMKYLAWFLLILSNPLIANESPFEDAPSGGFVSIEQIRKDLGDVKYGPDFPDIISTKRLNRLKNCSEIIVHKIDFHKIENASKIKAASSLRIGSRMSKFDKISYIIDENKKRILHQLLAYSSYGDAPATAIKATHAFEMVSNSGSVVLLMDVKSKAFFYSDLHPAKDGCVWEGARFVLNAKQTKFFENLASRLNVDEGDAQNPN